MVELKLSKHSSHTERAEGSALNGGVTIDWTFDEAQSNLDQLVDLVLAEGPQYIRIGEAAVVVVSEKTFELLSRRKPTLKELLLNGPDLSDLDLSRNQSPSRKFEW